MPRILLVEDNDMNRDMLSRRLVRNGYEVFLAIDGQQGIDMALSDHPDLILMDMSLPVIDGWEATRRIKANDATRGIPVIALTAQAAANGTAPQKPELYGTIKEAADGEAEEILYPISFQQGCKRTS